MDEDILAQSAQLHSTRPQIAILDFGSQYSHLIARRVRQLHVFCELYSCLVSAEALRSNNVVGIILSGGPNSVYDEFSPHVAPEVWSFIQEKQLPVLGICYGMQELAHTFGGEVSPSPEREYGRAEITKVIDDPLMEGVNHSQMWMSHGDKVTKMPEGFTKIAVTSNSEHAAIANAEKCMYGLQFHPEVTHSINGTVLLKNFVVGVCKAPTDWNMQDIASTFIRDVQNKVGPNEHVIGAVSGGVDSSVAATLLHKAIGERFHAVMVDNGTLRKDEAKTVSERLRDKLGINLIVIDASDIFLGELDGVSDPEKKRKTIGRLFIETFQKQAEVIEKETGGNVKFLLQGTLYPDVIESISYKGPSATIKTHHNVGGLPASMNLRLIEPLRELFKDEVRELGIALGIDKDLVWRHPFPGPGLAIRILGEITKERLELLREADAIMIQELRAAEVYNEIAQAFVVLLPVKSVGVMGDQRTYEQAVAMRCVTSADFMTADWYHMDYELLGKIANRIINEVKGINRVCYDVSSKPPATIEWE